jgi:hypothetical protein
MFTIPDLFPNEWGTDENRRFKFIRALVSLSSFIEHNVFTNTKYS